MACPTSTGGERHENGESSGNPGGNRHAHVLRHSTEAGAQRDPRIGQLQDQVNNLQKQLAERDAELDALKKSDAEKQTALEMAAQKDEKELNERVADLKRIFAKEIARGDLDIRRFRDVLIVSVKDLVFFAPDSPNLRPESFSLLKELAGVFKSAPDRIVRVEGNTAVAASSPETLRLYPTSWHLGAARAANVVQYLQEKGGMDPLQLVATSLGEYRPRADNSTEEGQEKNRRVDFVLVARSLYEINQLKFSETPKSIGGGGERRRDAPQALFFVFLRAGADRGKQTVEGCAL